VPRRGLREAGRRRGPQDAQPERNRPARRGLGQCALARAGRPHEDQEARLAGHRLREEPVHGVRLSTPPYEGHAARLGAYAFVRSVSLGSAASRLGLLRGRHRTISDGRSGSQWRVCLGTTCR
jgi:hypothetical protein